MLLTSVLCFFSIISFIKADSVSVTIPNGRIKGRKEYSLRGISFWAFQQIPFAKPPVGELRFQDPQPVKNWEGTLDASQNKQTLCFQQNNVYNLPNKSAVETEDCLYLNVYTPTEPSNETSLPVMFYIFGGGFVDGGNSLDFFGPHYLMENGVIVVIANYRLGPFGFLATGDTVLPGNYGLKDQLFALHWVKNNIPYFGGDPDKVTIFGESAGAASVTFHLMSKKSTGLFRAAIAQSGSGISPWAYQKNYKEIAYDVASSLNTTFDKASDSATLLAFLKKASAEDLNKAACDFPEQSKIEQAMHGFRFTPIVEPDHENAFITENMYSAIENGHMNGVPLMMGICSEEAIATATDPNFKSYVVIKENDISRLVNKNMHLVDDKQKKAAGEAIRRIYTDGLLQDDLGKTIRYFSDMCFNRAQIRHAEMQSKYSDVYFYQFSYYGSLGGTRPYIEGAHRVSHAEDNNYLWSRWNETSLNKYAANDILTSDRFRALFTNFAKYLNPIPQSSGLFENVTWPKVKPDDFQYLDINETLTVKKNPKGDVYPKWVDLYDKVALKPYDTY